jgi:hypothetical protein
MERLFMACRFHFVYTLIVLLGLTADVSAQENQRYVWLTQGKPTGEQIVTRDGNHLVIDFSYNDRGRGPNTKTTVLFDDAGTINSLKVTGVNYSKGKVDEWFIAENGRARWQSAKDRGNLAHVPGTYYLAVDSAPYQLGLLVKEALTRPDKVLDLYPMGQMRVETMSSLTLADGKKATLYHLHGLDVGPTQIWLDDDQNLFGVDNDWTALLPAGYEDARLAMQTAQTDALKAYSDALGDRYITQASGAIVISNTRLFQPATGELSDPATVTISDGRIAKIEGANAPVAAGSHVIDGSSQILMPSLVDMHGHYSDDQFLHVLSAGVTIERDMGNSLETLKRLIRQVKSGELLGPDIYPMGFIDGKSEFSAPIGQLPETLSEAKEMVDVFHAEGFKGIKLYSSLPVEWVRPLAQYAAAKGMTTMGHVPSGMSAADAIESGFTEITHFNMIMLNFLGVRDLDTRKPDRFIVPGKLGHTIDPDGKAYGDFLTLMKQKNISVDPTLSIFLNMFYAEPGTIQHSARPFADHMPASVRRWLIQTPTYNAGYEEAFRKSGEVAEKMLKRMYDEGISISLGTDSGDPGFVLISEMLNYERIGIPAKAILRMATSDAVAKLGLSKELGAIEVGKKAHLILVKGNPTENIMDLYRISYTFKGDLIVDAQGLRSGMGIKPWN